MPDGIDTLRPPSRLEKNMAPSNWQQQGQYPQQAGMAYPNQGSVVSIPRIIVTALATIVLGYFFWTFGIGFGVGMVWGIQQGGSPSTTTTQTTDGDDEATVGTDQPDDPMVTVDSDEVTEVDLRLARESGAPDDVIASLEKGVWPSEDDKVFIRRTNLAIAYMKTQYGEECKPTGTFYGPSQGLLFSKENTIVLLEIASGDNEGASVEVHVAIDGDKVFCSDSYKDVAASSSTKKAYEDAIRSAMSDIPEDSWVMQVNAQYVLFSRVFVAPGILNDEASVQERANRIGDAVKAAGIDGDDTVIVLAEAPADGKMTKEYVDSVKTDEGYPALFQCDAQ